MSADEPDPEADDGPEFDVFRNEPSPPYRAHLFAADDVLDAGGTPSIETDQPVTAICDSTRSYGPFRRTDQPVDEIDDELCWHCRRQVWPDEDDEDAEGEDQ